MILMPNIRLMYTPINQKLIKTRHPVFTFCKNTVCFITKNSYGIGNNKVSITKAVY
jgi:hypothetical protein